ncbi:hypothetical protein CWI38_1754p0010 [Hamiltosporidium tvaerminnensis]|uniref:Uncharacterized protein n=1 Tax=Hamiltosporidium tvaerminnensis TaxID=1176355 RepID=A0A4Q9LQG3_9MICR|nr:hypothetical protein CWI38_1754p0010 [Hamiltosporidium tvaerminnensis]
MKNLETAAILEGNRLLKSANNNSCCEDTELFLKKESNRRGILTLMSFEELVSVNESLRWFKEGSIRPRVEEVLCYIQDRNVFRGKKVSVNTAKRVYNCSLNIYQFKHSKRIRGHSVEKIL